MAGVEHRLARHSDRAFKGEVVDAVVQDGFRVAAVCRVAEITAASDPAFDRITNLAARVLDVPSATITLIHEDRQDFVSRIENGRQHEAEELTPVPLNASFCRHTVVLREPLIVEDAREHEVLRHNDAVADGVIAYAGVPLFDSDGQVLGSLCVYDSKPRRWVGRDVAVLQDLAESVVTEVALREDIVRRETAEAELRQSEERFRAMFECCPDGILLIDTAEPRTIVGANPAFLELIGGSEESVIGLSPRSLFDQDDAEQMAERASELGSLVGRALSADMRLRRQDGTSTWVAITVSEMPDTQQFILYARDIEQRKQHEVRMRVLAEHDALTGLHNRRRFDEELTRVIGHARRYGERAALVLLDLDNFKPVNDTLGHAAGDSLLREVSHAISRVLRATDLIARIGGDEFAVVLHHLDAPEAEQVAEKIRGAIAAIAVGDGEIAPVTASIGVTMVSGRETADAEQLMATADAALYGAKRAGRDRVTLLDPANAHSAA